jgi:mono/diheme cytochrome c family protein
VRGAVVVLVSACFLAAGCGSQGTHLPTASKVIGTLPKAGGSLVKGDPAAGKKLFGANGCGGCHTYKPAGSKGQTGPDLDKLAKYAQQANQGSLADFTRESIINPSAYVQPGYPDVMPKSYNTLPDKQVADLVAFLTTKR